MCIRDSIDPEMAHVRVNYSWLLMLLGREAAALSEANRAVSTWGCLLYTSDAADERSSVDLGGRRIIKKKKKSRNRGVHHL